MRGKSVRRAMCAEQRSVCGRCVVRGAPKRICRSVRRGMEKVVKRRATKDVYCDTALANLPQIILQKQFR